jgi:hypothetical protein
MAEAKEKVFFGASEKKKFFLPGSKEQWIEHIKLNEGQRRQYEDATSRKVSYDQAREMVEMDVAVGSDRAALFNAAVVGYNVLVNDADGNDVWKNGFEASVWEDIQNKMPSEMAQELLEDIRNFNSWLLPDQSKKK